MLKTKETYSELFSQNATYYGYTKEKQKKNKRKAAKISFAA